MPAICCLSPHRASCFALLAGATVQELALQGNWGKVLPANFKNTFTLLFIVFALGKAILFGRKDIRRPSLLWV